MTMLLTVGAVARAAGVTPKTVRYYEALGLLPAAARGANGYRRFSPDALSHLTFVLRTKALGLSLDEIRALMAVAPDGGCASLTQELRKLMARKLAACDTRIAELTELRAVLAAAAEQLARQEASCDEPCPTCSFFTPECACLPTSGIMSSRSPLDIAARVNV